ncbi:MAG: hypothetical protein JWQ07_5269 [Ramlibacter sp.]|nr:hypothetical protein [Ramlibacter sp.]
MLAAAVLAGGMMGSIVWPGDNQTPPHLMREGFSISAAAVVGETAGPISLAPYTLVRFLCSQIHQPWLSALACRV